MQGLHIDASLEHMHISSLSGVYETPDIKILEICAAIEHIVESAGAVVIIVRSIRIQPLASCVAHID